MNMRSGRWVLEVSLALCALGCDSERGAIDVSSRESSTQTPVTLMDLDGRAAQPLRVKDDQRGTVLIFVAAECPICNAYVGEINRLSQMYANKGVGFLLVDVDSNVATADISRHVREYKMAPAVLLDPGHKLADKLGAMATPEAFLINRSDEIVYRGRIDDLYIGLGQRRYEATRHDLRDAIDAVISGRPVPVKTTMPVGCAI